MPSRLLGATLLSLGLAVLAGCGDDTPTSPDDPLVEKLVAMGFRRDMIVDQGQSFLVEGDILIRKDQLEVPFPSPQFQWAINELVSQSNVGSVVVDLGSIPNDEPAWATAIRDAITHWSGLPGGGFLLAESTPAAITFSMFDTVPSILAIASWPEDGTPGPTIRINRNFPDPTPGTKVFAMVHELGHTVGFRHTNWQTNDCPPPPFECGTGPGANQIAGTPQTDAASVMNGGDPTLQWQGFSRYDKVATRALYPGFGPTAQGSVISNQPRLTWDAQPEAIRYKVYFGGEDPSSHTVQATITSTTYTSWIGPALSVRTCDYSLPNEKGYFVAPMYDGGLGPEQEIGKGSHLCFEFLWPPVVTGAITDGLAHLTWPPVRNAVTYRVYRQASNMDAGGTEPCTTDWELWAETADIEILAEPVFEYLGTSWGPYYSAPRYSYYVVAVSVGGVTSVHDYTHHFRTWADQGC